eukprot:1161214-Pelagomonas_calceolata.AAC.16
MNCGKLEHTGLHAVPSCHCTPVLTAGVSEQRRRRQGHRAAVQGEVWAMEAQAQAHSKVRARAQAQARNKVLLTAFCMLSARCLVLHATGPGTGTGTQQGAVQACNKVRAQAQVQAQVQAQARTGMQHRHATRALLRASPQAELSHWQSICTG